MRWRLRREQCALRGALLDRDRPPLGKTGKRAGCARAGARVRREIRRGGSGGDRWAGRRRSRGVRGGCGRCRGFRLRSLGAGGLAGARSTISAAYSPARSLDVGLDEERAAGDEHATELRQELGRDDQALGVALFPPRVGEMHEYGAGAGFREAREGAASVFGEHARAVCRGRVRARGCPRWWPIYGEFLGRA